MAVNLIVASTTCLMLGFIVIWRGWPSCRPWIEAPKFPPARWDEEAMFPNETKELL